MLSTHRPNLSQSSAPSSALSVRNSGKHSAAWLIRTATEPPPPPSLAFSPQSRSTEFSSSSPRLYQRSQRTSMSPDHDPIALPAAQQASAPPQPVVASPQYVPLSAPDITDAEIDAVSAVLRTPHLSL